MTLSNELRDELSGELSRELSAKLQVASFADYDVCRVSTVLLRPAFCPA